MIYFEDQPRITVDFLTSISVFWAEVFGVFTSAGILEGGNREYAYLAK